MTKIKYALHIICFCIVSVLQSQEIQGERELPKSPEELAIEKRINATGILMYTKPKTAEFDFEAILTELDQIIRELPRGKRRNFLLKKAQILEYLAYLYHRESSFRRSLGHCFHSIKLKTDMGDLAHLGTPHVLAGVIQNDYNETDEALANIQKGLQIHKKSGNVEGISQALSYQANIYANPKVAEYVKAREQFKKALFYADSIQYPRGIAIASQLYGVFLREHINDSKASISYIQKALDIYEELNNSIGKEEAHSQLAKSFEVLGDIEKSIDHAKKAITLAVTMKSRKQMSQGYLALSNIYQKKADDKKALQFYQLHQKHEDTLQKKLNVKKNMAHELRLKFDMEKRMDSLKQVQEKERIAGQLDKEKATKTRNLMVFVGLGVLAILIVLYTRKSLQLTRIQKKVLQEELEESEKKIETKEEEITSLITESIQHINTKKKLVEDLKKISKEENSEVTLKSVIAELKADHIDDARLLMIRTNLEEVSFEFYKKLSELYPVLTKTDIEVCSYIRLGLSRKEIANLRNTTINAIKATRRRLKRKLDLTAEDSLDDFIKSI
ncbi:hypothetical protein [Aquimarina sp. MMG016]|uniref:tetratricopeptide repeat protein n=1 Tax=Aquimarina sp. MMG016 TaxID=2822690 RepID=UPI001B3A05A5|nr:hypothetical protein [Aquimarina sp. MMG016]MBQ4821717.1 hypothetical protein [Aquimarina sp. MMG016]